jgi:hypothetical protein
MRPTLHACEVAANIRQPDLRRHQPRFIDTRLREVPVDLRKNLLRLAFHIERTIIRRLSADEHQPCSLHNSAHPLIGFDPDDIIHKYSLFI